MNIPLWQLTIWIGVVSACVFVGLFALVAWWPDLHREGRSWLMPEAYVLTDDEKRQIHQHVYDDIDHWLSATALSDASKAQIRRDLMRKILPEYLETNPDLRLLRGSGKRVH